MRIKKELIPTDKLEEISVKQIDEILSYLLEPLKVSLDNIERPQYISSYNYDERKNRTFSGKLLSIGGGKALFQPIQGENDKIKYFDEVEDLKKRLFELKHKQTEAQKVENRALRKEVFKLFDEIFIKEDNMIYSPPFEFINNFDNVSTEKVYSHFKKELVDTKMITIEELEAYLKQAFELQEIPKILYSIKNTMITKGKVVKVFYQYYKDVAGKPHGNQNGYAGLLGNYFQGYKTSTIISNFSKSVY